MWIYVFGVGSHPVSLVIKYVSEDSCCTEYCRFLDECNSCAYLNVFRDCSNLLAMVHNVMAFVKTFHIILIFLAKFWYLIIFPFFLHVTLQIGRYGHIYNYVFFGNCVQDSNILTSFLDFMIHSYSEVPKYRKLIIIKVLLILIYSFSPWLQVFNFLRHETIFYFSLFLRR